MLGTKPTEGVIGDDHAVVVNDNSRCTGETEVFGQEVLRVAASGILNQFVADFVLGEFADNRIALDTGQILPFIYNDGDIRVVHHSSNRSGRGLDCRTRDGWFMCFQRSAQIHASFYPSAHESTLIVRKIMNKGNIYRA